MMKKIYTKPDVQAIEVMHHNCLLTGSGESVKSVVTPDDEEMDFVPVKEGIEDDEEDV
ncbi:hypothetical protein L6468_04610 [Prevotella communis]|uniref:hypothetical protein n=1 Tax=Prevotella communis TaxID=2913614 RepID=UPI001EDC2040|nr:hypothetical protein [Prevotella communis]UKK63051.1 hypothetical protein L6468_04610 [Prevotella communis]UKK65876.1 hypothetical protein L6473_04610 [Prevotella communis]